MSIIQEALKKAQEKEPSKKVVPGEELHHTSVQGGAPFQAVKNKFTSKPILLAIFTVVALAAAWQFFFPAKSGMRHMAGRPFKETISHQEILYKPIADKRPDGVWQNVNLLAYLERSQPRFVLNGIMYLESGPQAIINDSLVKEGDMINRASVVKINKNSVTLNREGAQIQLILRK